MMAFTFSRQNDAGYRVLVVFLVLQSWGLQFDDM